MKTVQHTWTSDTEWSESSGDVNPQLVLAMGARSALENAALYDEVNSMYPDTNILWCSTAGEIAGARVLDDSLVVTAIEFEKTTLQFAETSVKDPSESEEAGAMLAQEIPQENLTHVMVFSDGLKVNGTSLVNGITKHIPEHVSITGGLVGDGSDFKKTLVGLSEKPAEGKIVLIGFYGSSIKIGYGSLGGWDPFGPERMITKSEGNVLYELDDQPALALYKKYLEDKAEELPSSGLLFPLSLRLQDGDEEVEVVRTILAVDEEAQSMTFAGDMPEGVYAKLMRANFDRLVDGASGAASMSTDPLGSSDADLAILISCIGRKLVLKERTEEETEAVQEAVGEQATMTGFYSYGEICPTTPTEKQCQLHNQTMTITTFREE